MGENKICEVEDCNNKFLAKGLCNKHYKRMYTYGTLTLINKKLHTQFPREYNSWRGCKHRCSSVKYRKYNRYGGRGIQVCEEWNNSFEKFLNDMGPKPFPEAHLDRIDNDGNYCKTNCRWTSLLENNRNKSDTKLSLEKAKEIRRKYKEGGYYYKDLAKEYGVAPNTISKTVNNEIWQESILVNNNPPINTKEVV